MKVNTSPYGKIPPDGSMGRLIYNILDRACYPWENFAVERSDFHGWIVHFHTVQYNEKFYSDTLLTDELIAHMQGMLEDYLIRSIHDMRMFVTKWAVEHNFERKVTNK